MKLAYFNDFTLGIVRDDSVVDVSGIVRDIPHLGPHDLISGLIERWAQYRERLEEAAESSRSIPLGRVRLRAPLPRPGKMLCMARNFIESPDEEAQPLNAFLKSPNAVSDPGSTVVIPSAPAAIFEHEAELALLSEGRQKTPARPAWQILQGGLSQGLRLPIYTRLEGDSGRSPEPRPGRRRFPQLFEKR